MRNNITQLFGFDTILSQTFIAAYKFLDVRTAVVFLFRLFTLFSPAPASKSVLAKKKDFLQM